MANSAYILQARKSNCYSEEGVYQLNIRNWAFYKSNPILNNYLKQTVETTLAQA